MKFDIKRLTKTTAFVLVLLMLITSIAMAIPKGVVEPENPLVTKTEELKVDIRTASGASSNEKTEMELESQSMSEEQSTESEQSEETPPEQPPQEPETPPEETDEQESEDISEELEPKQEEGKGASEEVSGETEKTDPNLPGNNESGETPNENGDELQDNPGTGEAPDKDEHGLVTDLKSGIILFS